MTENTLRKLDGCRVRLTNKLDDSVQIGVVEVVEEEWIGYYRGVCIHKMHAGFYFDTHHSLRVKYYGPRDLKHLTMEVIK